MEQEKSNLQSEFNKSAELMAQLSLDLMDLSKNLRKNQIYRVFMAVMEYPSPPTKQLADQEEVDVYNLGTALKEMQMRMGVINLAIKEEESRNGKENTSV